MGCAKEELEKSLAEALEIDCHAELGAHCLGLTEEEYVPIADKHREWHQQFNAFPGA